MTSIVSIALAGFFVWSGAASGTPEVLPLATVTISTPAVIKGPSFVRLSGYNALPEQTDNSPETTASGARSNPEVIAARSRDLAEILPFGTVIFLETPQKAFSCGFSEVEHLIGYRVIADTMHSRKSRQIDVMFDAGDSVNLGGKDTNPAVALGMCDVTVRVVGKIALKDIPATQSELALLVNKKIALR